MVEKMSGDLGQNSRASKALSDRVKSISNYNKSDTAKEKNVRHPEQFKIKFDKGTLFLSAVSSGDLEETESLLNEGVDIDFTNIDGLAALHQACIDENEEMVSLLVERGANIEARDNEGWTPLHAAASAGNVEIAKILIEHGADLAAVNNEGEVPLDLADEQEMVDFLTDEIEGQDLDVEEARNEEERLMVEHATSWLNKKKIDEKLDWQDATALHVAASKGYTKVINIILKIPGADVNVKDCDGWTPLHAAVHWGSKSACELLTDFGADFEIMNNNGQTPCDLADKEFQKTAEACKKKSADAGLAKKSKGTSYSFSIEKEMYAIELLKKEAPRPAIKGGRVQQQTLETNNNTSNNCVIDNKQKTKEVKNFDSENSNTSTSGNASTNRVTVNSLADTVSVKLPRGTSVTVENDSSKTDSSKTDNSVLNSSNRNKLREDLPRSSLLKSDPVETPSSRSVPLKNDKENAETSNRSLSSRTDKVENDSAASRISSWRSQRTTENNDVKSTSENSTDKKSTPLSRYQREEVPSRNRADRSEKEDEEEVKKPPEDTSVRKTTGVAERLRLKNQELLSSIDRSTDRVTERTTDRVTERTTTDRPSYSDRTSVYSRDQNSTVSVKPNSKISSSADVSDTKEIQRKLDQTEKELQEYKEKYEKLKKEKEDLENKLSQYQEDLEKMQELKNDNVRLKDENGALIRVISKLSRTPASSS
ncbi:protein phosphatase 1 regulatory subunit 12A isoform X1 [Hydra vulgaris]|uniref:Protein phosphatase 1 regulatory subunit 12A n=1 Tax=Hydra vulgaris TaxID=6087 RepID=T2MJI9_HYDVU|nr:protein phosphatase 1 regulatory subunit 12A-like isoform X1 [Hydra vulgaris]